jgi:tetratricopeptide (TPR) repeat protein
VVAADPKNPGPLSYYARRLLQLDRTSPAAEPLARLEKLIPDSALAVTLRGRYLFQRGELQALLFHVNGYVSRGKIDSDKFERMFVAGTLLDEFARSTLQPANQPDSAKRLCDAAISLYRDCVQAKPDALVRAAALNGHFGNLKGALAMLDQPGIPKNLKASATIEALRAAHADDAQCASTEQWLMGEARQRRTHDLVMHLADLEEMKHNFHDAEDLYREVLKTQPDNVVAMNNLAWVMAHYKPNTEALELVQRAITIAGPLADLLDTRAKVYLSLGRSAEAIQDLEDAINEAPTAKRYFQLALAEERNRNPSAAKTAFSLARRYGIDARDLHPDDARMFERMAKSS